MTPAELRQWIDTQTNEKGRRISDAEAARRLGCSPNGLRAWLEGKRPVPLTIALACAALARGIAPWPQ